MRQPSLRLRARAATSAAWILWRCWRCHRKTGIPFHALVEAHAAVLDIAIEEQAERAALSKQLAEIRSLDEVPR